MWELSNGSVENIIVYLLRWFKLRDKETAKTWDSGARKWEIQDLNKLCWAAVEIL